MKTLRTLSLAALMSAGVFATPALALDLGGTVGGTVGGAIGSGGIGGSIGGSADGALGGTLRAGDRVGTINDRANRLIDRTRSNTDRAANAIELPAAPSADQIDAALKAAGYGDAALNTPVGSGSGSAEGSFTGERPAIPATPALPDPAAAANGAVDRAVATKDMAVTRVGSAVPAVPVMASGSISGSANGDLSTSSANGPGTEASSEPAGNTETTPAAAEPAPRDRTETHAERRDQIEPARK